jgi:hypothetical protein
MKHLPPFLLTILAIFAPIEAAVAAAFVLVTCDMILGILAARKRGEPITSSGLRRSLSKLIIFESAIVLGFITEHFLTGDFMPVSKIITAYIGLVEIKSIVESLNELNGSNIFSALIAKLGSENDKLK